MHAFYYVSRSLHHTSERSDFAMTNDTLTPLTTLIALHMHFPTD